MPHTATAHFEFKEGYARRIEIALAGALVLLVLAVGIIPPRSLRLPPPSAAPHVLQIQPPLADPAPVYLFVDPYDPGPPSALLNRPVPAPIEITADHLVPIPKDINPFAKPLVLGGKPGGAGTLPPKGLAPVVLHRVSPVYPELAREAGAEGVVRLEVLIAPSGQVLSARVIASDTVRSLEEAARQAALQWLFRPARQGTAPVGVKSEIEFRFRLD